MYSPGSRSRKLTPSCLRVESKTTVRAGMFTPMAIDCQTTLVEYLIEDDPLQVADDVRAVVQHGAEDFRRHDQTRGLGFQLNVAGYQTDIAKCLLEISELLVGQHLQGKLARYS